MKMKSYLLFLVLFFCSLFQLVSQQKELPKTSETRPLELPTIFIEGKENLNVQSGTKQFLDKTLPLTKDDLDSINSLEKQISMLIPFKPLNESMVPLTFKRGYFSGEYGMYNSPKFIAGYKFSIDDYKLSLDGGLDLSKGHIKNSGYTKIFAKVGSEYIAPEKFLFFGGSLTTLDLNFKHNNYKLYALSEATDRSTTLLSFDIMSDGRYDVFDFQTGAQLKTHILSQSNNNTADNTINGFLNIDGNFEDFFFGAGASIDFRNLRNNPYTFFEIYGKVKYDFNDLVFKGRGGIQMTQSTLGESRQGVIVDAELSYVFNNFFNAFASFSTFLEKNSFSTALELNPYISDSSVIDFAYPVNFQASVNYHPDMNFYVNIKGKYSLIDRTPYFLNSDTGRFNLHYDKSSSLNFEIEGVYNFSDEDLLSVFFLLQNNELSSGKKVPYKEPFRLSANYRKKWFENLRTNLEIFYVGSRFVDKENTKEVGGFIDFKLGGTFSLSKNFDVFLKIENLFNSDIKYWNGYKERDIFLTAGIFWKF